MAYTYPVRDIDRSRVLLDLLGSHWSSLYAGEHLVERYAYARGQVEYQTHLDLLELIASFSRFDVPIFHTDQWYLLTLRESELNSALVRPLEYGDNVVFGHQPDTGREYLYGDGFDDGTYNFPLPADLTEVSIGFNRITSPSVTYTAGVDFKFDSRRQAISFRENPFDNPLISQRDVYDEGNVVDREAAIWLFRGKFDWQHVYTHFGYVLDLFLQSSERYRDLVNVIWTSLIHGSNNTSVQTALSAICDVPLVVNPIETVEVVQRDHRYLHVVTDQQAYRFHRSAEPVVAVGDVLHAGQPVSDTLKFFEFNRGQLEDDLLSITLGEGFLISGYYGGLTFENKTVPLQVSKDGVFTRVEFEIGGWPGDVIKFWDDFHDRGVAAGQTLAHLLDRRTNKVGEPSAAALPTTINPLQFLVENVLRNNAFAVRIKLHTLGENSLGIERIRELRKLIPPHTAMLVLLELAADDDPVTMEGPGSEEAPGYEESPEIYLAGEPIEESLDPDSHISEEEPTLRYIDGICL